MTIIDKYKQLSKNILISLHACSEHIFCIANTDKNSKYKYFNKLLFESFKNIESVLTSINLVAYSQATALLRKTIEQFAIVKTLFNHQSALDEYNKYSKVRLLKAINDPSADDLIAELTQGKNIEQKYLNSYLDYGWINKITTKRPCIDTILMLADIEDIKEWRNHCNNFVHNNLSYLSFDNDTVSYQIKTIIYFCAFMYDHLIHIIHKTTGFDFIINGTNYALLHKDLLKDIGKSRGAK